MKKFIFICIFTFISFYSFSQGCVAIKSNGMVCTMQHEQNKQNWQLNVSYRYFKSFRHFNGTVEQTDRIENNTEVINHQHSLNYTLSRKLNKRWSIALDFPIVSNSRSSLYEHYGNSSTSPNARQSTHSFGIGDLRVSGYYTVFDAEKFKKGNIQLGFGIKLPTGDYKYQDYFHKNDTTLVMAPVDQSIQLGDGGTGFTTEVNGHYNFSKHLSVYGNFYYLFNPREQNGVSTQRGNIPTALTILSNSDVMSVTDQYLIRAGANFSFKRLSVSAGGRMECVPVYDLIGGSNGFRRPGYVISVEPGMVYEFKKFTAFATVPIALKRDRTQSVSDKIKTTLTGVYTQGDAAFADYTINAGMYINF